MEKIYRGFRSRNIWDTPLPLKKTQHKIDVNIDNHDDSRATIYLNSHVKSQKLFQRSRKCTNLFIYNTQLASQYLVGGKVTKETIRYIKRSMASDFDVKVSYYVC